MYLNTEIDKTASVVYWVMSHSTGYLNCTSVHANSVILVGLSNPSRNRASKLM